MADFGAPVAQNVDTSPNKGIQTLSGLLGLQQQKLALQGQAADVQQTQQTARQRANVAGFMSTFDPTKHVGSDGTLDLDEVLTDPKLRAAAGDQFPQIMQSMIQAKQGQLQAKQQLANLNDSLRNQFSSTVGSLRTDPDVMEDNAQGRAKVHQALGDFAASGGEDAGRVAQVYGQVLQHVPPGKLSQTLSNFQLQAMDASTQSGRQAPTYAGAGNQLVQTNPQAAGGGNIPVGIAPGANVLTDAYGRQFVHNPQTNSLVPLGAGPAQGTGGASGFAQPVADQAAALAELRETRAATAQGGITRNVNNRLLELSKETNTGGFGTKTGQEIAATLGLPSGTRFQEIGAYLDRQAALQAQVMGVPHTNAGLAAAERATGTTDYTPKALQEKVKFFDALNSGSMAYRQGLDKAVGTGPTPDLSRYQAYRSAWAKNFDPDVFRVEDAQRRGDTAELESIRKRVGKTGMSDLAQKSANLRQLENGVIPGG